MASSAVDRIRAEQARTLFRNCPVGVLSAATGAILLAIALAATGRVTPFYAALWGGLMLGCVALHLALCAVFWRVAPPDAAWRRWLGLFTAVAALEGVTWFCGAIWMTSSHDLTQELMVLLVSSAIASGAVSLFGTYLPTYYAFFFPAILPHLGFGLFYDYPLHGLLTALLIAYLVAMSLIARRTNRQLVEGLRLRFANIDLIEDLRLQKARADAANRAKSSFLAAASHDLRQPIHALGMFIGALRGRTIDDAAERLLDHIDGSVAAMDDLFAALLDISKLDAGVVEARLTLIAIEPLLERVCRDYAAEAAAKGIRLRRVRSTAIVCSDASLLEQIVRNLIANGVRYTDSGTVLIGCRRRGATLRLEVHDTGCGIAPADQAAIFQEFFQIGNPERDRSRGLGLGLAIVRRVAALLGATIDLTSAPGQGSEFVVTVPLSDERAATVAPDEVEVVSPIASALILVIDDEAAIQTATASLLTRWGHRVIVAESADAMLARLGEGVGSPDLLISDYRLRGDGNGIVAIRRVLAVCPRPIPAMLITGDTDPERIGEAQASGFLLLHKPLSNAKLRAAIGNLLRDSDASRGFLPDLTVQLTDDTVRS